MFGFIRIRGEHMDVISSIMATFDSNNFNSHLTFTVVEIWHLNFILLKELINVFVRIFKAE